MSATAQLTMPETNSRSRQRAALAAAMLGFAVVTLDAQIVNVGCPRSTTTSAAACRACNGSSRATEGAIGGADPSRSRLQSRTRLAFKIGKRM